MMAMEECQATLRNIRRLRLELECGVDNNYKDVLNVETAQSVKIVTELSL